MAAASHADVTWRSEAPAAGDRDVFIVLGNQLFPFAHFKPHREARFFMAEDEGLCTYVKHHKQKLVLFLAAMRSHADELRRHNARVHYERLDAPERDEHEEDEPGKSYESKLARFLDDQSPEADRLVMFEIEDKFFERRIVDFAARRQVELTFLPSPMFLSTRDHLDSFFDEHAPFMARFYRAQRKRLGVLVNADGSPIGGRWSFDTENRKPPPRGFTAPAVRLPTPTAHVHAVRRLVESRFADHPGELDDWWLPTTRRQALAGLHDFLTHLFDQFGDYEDAIARRETFVHHSLLSPALNLGLITPREVLDRALDHAQRHDVPINSVEGFVRQIIGWREFVRGVYRRYSQTQETRNFFDHRRQMKRCWWTGETGLLPLDDVIRKARRYGWTHHIERLMIVSNLMNLCEIEPRRVFAWFMSMYVDSSDWVMAPNVYGMGLMSDGGVFATKPYICGSNYVLKMSDYARPDRKEAAFASVSGGRSAPAHWADVMDGLYWRFVKRHRAFFERQPRLAMMTRSLDRMDTARKSFLFAAAERFLESTTARA